MHTCKHFIVWLVLKFILRPSSSAASASKKKADAAAAAAAAAAASAAAAADGPKKKQQRSSISGFTANSSRKLNEDPEVSPLFMAFLSSLFQTTTASDWADAKCWKEGRSIHSCYFCVDWLHPSMCCYGCLKFLSNWCRMKRSSRFGSRKHFSENSLLLMVWTSLQISKSDAQFFGLGCDLNDMSAPLPHLSHIRRMMKRQVLECGIQVPLSPF